MMEIIPWTWRRVMMDSNSVYHRWTCPETILERYLINFKWLIMKIFNVKNEKEKHRRKRIFLNGSTNEINQMRIFDCSIDWIWHLFEVWDIWHSQFWEKREMHWSKLNMINSRCDKQGLRALDRSKVISISPSSELKRKTTICSFASDENYFHLIILLQWLNIRPLNNRQFPLNKQFEFIFNRFEQFKSKMIHRKRTFIKILSHMNIDSNRLIR